MSTTIDASAKALKEQFLGSQEESDNALPNGTEELLNLETGVEEASDDLGEERESVDQIALQDQFDERVIAFEGQCAQGALILEGNPSAAAAMARSVGTFVDDIEADLGQMSPAQQEKHRPMVQVVKALQKEVTEAEQADTSSVHKETVDIFETTAKFEYARNLILAA